MDKAQNQIDLLENIYLSYQDMVVFRDFSFQVEKNKITCLVGPSGCGKTSILNILAGLNTSYQGGCNSEARRLGYVFQEDRLLPWKTVYQNISLVKVQEDKAAILDLLEAVELLEFKDNYPDQLSGGMRQRCSIARAYYYDSDMLLMDEPFKSLDYELRFHLVRLLGDIYRRQPKTIIFVTHDIDEALLLGHQVMILSNRPTKMESIYSMTSPIQDRDINDPTHIAIRNNIIKDMKIVRRKEM